MSKKEFTNQGDQTSQKKALIRRVTKVLCVLLALLLVVVFASVISQKAKKSKNNAMFEDAEHFIKLKEYGKAREMFSKIKADFGESLQLKSAERRLERLEGAGTQIQRIEDAIFKFEWDNARAEVETLKEIDPYHKQLESLPQRIDTLEKERLLFTLAEKLKVAEEEQDWFSIHAASKQLVENSDEEHPDRKKWEAIYQDAEVKMETRRKKAMELFQQAKDADTGEYNEEAIQLITEARNLYASDYIELLYLKLSSYPRIINVPADVATIGEAILQANRNDTISLAAGNYRERLIVDKKVKLSADIGAVVTISENPSEGSVVFVSAQGDFLCSGITFKHDLQLRDEQEFAVVHIEGEARLNEVKVLNGSGHGIVVTEDGKLFATKSVISKNRWSGLALINKSKVDIFQCELISNGANGIDIWGAQSDLSADEVIVNANTHSGLFCGKGTGKLSIMRSEFSFNKELGIYLAGSQSGLINNVKVNENELGGVYKAIANESVTLESSEVKRNGFAGIILNEGARILKMSSNEVLENKGLEVWYEADKKPEKTEEEIAEEEAVKQYENIDTSAIPKAILIEE